MVSVTSEVSASASFQTARARSARPDSSHRPETTVSRRWSTATAAGANDNVAGRSSAQDTRPRRADDSQADRTTAGRVDTAAADKASRNDAQRGPDRPRTAGNATPSADANNATAKADSPPLEARPIVEVRRFEVPKPTNQGSVEDVMSADDASATDRTTGQDAAAGVAAADAIAVAIPATAAPTATSPASTCADVPRRWRSRQRRLPPPLPLPTIAPCCHTGTGTDTGAGAGAIDAGATPAASAKRQGRRLQDRHRGRHSLRSSHPPITRHNRHCVGGFRRCNDAGRRQGRIAAQAPRHARKVARRRATKTARPMRPQRLTQLPPSCRYATDRGCGQIESRERHCGRCEG